MVNPAIDQAVAAWKAGDRNAGPMLVALTAEDRRAALAMLGHR
jgi:hypothetical protein